jgi:hypothetical protein
MLLLACFVLIVVLKLATAVIRRRRLVGVIGVVAVLAVGAAAWLVTGRTLRMPCAGALVASARVDASSVEASGSQTPCRVSAESRGEVTGLKSAVRDHAHKLRLKAGKLRGDGVPWTILTALAVAAFLYVGYVFLDAGTRGHFTWSLRLVSIVVFAAICAMMAALRHGL